MTLQPWTTRPQMGGGTYFALVNRCLCDSVGVHMAAAPSNKTREVVQSLKLPMAFAVPQARAIGVRHAEEGMHANTCVEPRRCGLSQKPARPRGRHTYNRALG